MICLMLAREDSAYKAFLDIAMASDGILICTYWESLMHGPRPFTRVVVQMSQNGGLNWGEKKVVDACEDGETERGFNAPRLLSLTENPVQSLNVARLP